MYGFEEVDGGAYGGVAAQTPFPDVYFPEVLRMSGDSSTPLIGGAGPTGANILPYTSLGDQVPGSAMPPSMNASGTAATVPVSGLQNHWSSVLDFHNSPAPWILIGILLLYGWIHVSVRGSVGHARAGAFLS